MPFRGFEHSPAFDVRDVVKHQRPASQVDLEYQRLPGPLGGDQQAGAIRGLFEPRVGKRGCADCHQVAAKSEREILMTQTKKALAQARPHPKRSRDK